MKKQRDIIIKKVQKIINNILNYSKSHFVPGSGRITIFTFFHHFWTGIRNESIGIKAASLSFKLLLSLFPAMIFFFTLIPYLSSGGFQETFLLTLEGIMPEYTYKAIEANLTDILYKPKFGLLSFVFLLSLYYSISNMNSILSVFNKSHHLTDNRGYMRKLLVSLVLTLLMFLLIIITIVLISVNKNILNRLYEAHFLGSWFYIIALQYGRWLILFFAMLTWLSLFYTIGAPYKIKFRFFSPGSVFSSFFFILISIVFNILINHFLNYNEIYGALGVILIFFIWIYYNSVILLLGFEINASLFIAPNKNNINIIKVNIFSKWFKKIQKIPEIFDSIHTFLKK